MATATKIAHLNAKESLAAYLAAAPAPINWNGGQRLTLLNGYTAQCTALNNGQIYAVFLYNSGQNDNNVTVTMNWSNSQPPVQVVVPGTTGNQGPASLFLVSGTDTTTVSASVSPNQQNAGIDAWIGSVSMPTNTTGLNNQPLPNNGQTYPFGGYSRYYAVPPSSWQQLTIQSRQNQFLSVQFQENLATVNVVNAAVQPPNLVTAVGSAKTQFVTNISATGVLSYPLQGNGTQWVWMDADSMQNSQDATIALQQL